MKAIYVVLILAAISILGCNQEGDTTALLDGNYIGTFQRGSKSANVTLQFNNGTFSGSTDTSRFPGVCSGTYQVSGDSIRFINECIWTADFDWSLILNDRWGLVRDNELLILTNELGDRYQLIAQ